MPTATRPADAVEAMVERAQREGQASLAQLRSGFEAAGVGPAEARAVLKRLTEAGVVSGTDEPQKRTRSTTPSAGPTPGRAGRSSWRLSSKRAASSC